MTITTNKVFVDSSILIELEKGNFREFCKIYISILLMNFALKTWLSVNFYFILLAYNPAKPHLA